MSEDKIEKAARLIKEAANEEAEQKYDHVDFDTIRGVKQKKMQEVKNEVFGPYGY